MWSQHYPFAVRCAIPVNNVNNNVNNTINLEENVPEPNIDNMVLDSAPTGDRSVINTPFDVKTMIENDQPQSSIGQIIDIQMGGAEDQNQDQNQDQEDNIVSFDVKSINLRKPDFAGIEPPVKNPWIIFAIIMLVSVVLMFIFGFFTRFLPSSSKSENAIDIDGNYNFKSV